MNELVHACTYWHARMHASMKIEPAKCYGVLIRENLTQYEKSPLYSYSIIKLNVVATVIINYYF